MERWHTAVLIHNVSRLKPDEVEEYDRRHRELPSDVRESIERAGVSQWLIWREGPKLHQVIECDDWEAARAELAVTTPAHWLRDMGALTDPDFEPVLGDAASFVWRLFGQTVDRLP